MPSRNAHEFAIRHILGIPILVERWAVPSRYDSPGSWEWSRWRLCRFSHTLYVNTKLLEMRRP